MISIIPKPYKLALQSGNLRISLPLRLTGNTRTQHTIDHLLARLGANGQISSRDVPAHIFLELNEGLLPELGEEGYKLDITSTHVDLNSARPSGLFYGCQTLQQLLPPNIAHWKQNDTLNLPCLSIFDKPRLEWRGFLLDEARHFFGMDTIKRVLDWLAFFKINVFHWHLTDYQGWRVEIKNYPRLTEIGGRRAGSQTRSFLKMYRRLDMTPYQGWYTQDEIREIVAYATERHITVIPELDLPGHFTAALAAYPNLGCTNEPMEVRCEWGIFEDIACVGNPDTRVFLKDVLDEFCTLFPGPYIHLGGDEVRTDHWQVCPQCQRLRQEQDLERFSDLVTFMMNDLGSYLMEKGKTPVVWNEALHPLLNKDIVIMHWTPGDSSMMKTKQALKDGFKIVLQTFRESYFDYPHSFVPLERVYQAKTFEDISPAMARNVLGTQGALWTEFVEDEVRIQWNTFPRLAAKAEVGWSHREVYDYENFQRRWEDLVLHLEEMGLKDSAPLAVCNPTLVRQMLAKFLDMRQDMQAEQKRWQSKKKN
jgi:hexosaminidase